MIRYRYGRSIWEIEYKWDIDMGIDMGYGLMIWEMTVSIRSSSISVWDVMSLRGQ